MDNSNVTKLHPKEKDQKSESSVGSSLSPREIVSELLGDSKKAREKLNWEPKITLEELIDEMINKDLEEAQKESILKKQGFIIHPTKE